MRRRLFGLGAALLVGALSATPATAQSPGALLPGGTVCRSLGTLCVDDTDCPMLDGNDQTCTSLSYSGSSVRICRPSRSALCCDAVHDCPEGSTCTTGLVDSVGVCLADSNEYCAIDPSPEQLTDCHTPPDIVGGNFPVAWDEGDCDGDGVRNGVEVAEGTLPCSAPPEEYSVYVTHADGSVVCTSGVVPCDPTLMDAVCTLDGTADATCVTSRRGGDLAPLCTLDPGVYCCGSGVGSEACPVGVCVIPSDDPSGDGYCAEAEALCGTSAAELEACHTGPRGAFPVPLGGGDCDGDGARNSTEINAGTDPCDETDFPLDAGVDADAGTDAMDAGPGAPEAPTFAGGGGCRCGAAGPRGRRVPVALLVALGFFVAIRRRG